MYLKKILLAVTFAVASFNSLHVLAQEAVVDDAQAHYSREQKTIVQTIFTKLSEKQPLNKEEKEFLQKVKNYGLGSLGGLTFFYIVPPVGFGIIGLFVAKVALGVAGGFGLVELSKRIDWQQVKVSLQEMFEQKAEA